MRSKLTCWMKGLSAMQYLTPVAGSGNRAMSCASRIISLLTSLTGNQTNALAPTARKAAAP
jgi:hypothetical protein